MLLFQWTWFKGINCIEARNNSDDYKAQGNYQCNEFSTMIYSTSNILRLTRLSPALRSLPDPWSPLYVFENPRSQSRVITSA